MKKYFFPKDSEIMKKKPDNSLWMTIRLNKETLLSKIKEFDSKNIEGLLAMLYIDFGLDIKNSDRIKLVVRNK